EDSGGRFVVAWMRNTTGYYTEIAARRYDAAGNAIGAEFRVNSTTSSNFGFPDVAPLRGGGFVVAWGVYGGGVSSIVARRFDASGSPLGTELRANTATDGQRYSASVASAAWLGTYIAAWAGPDGYDTGVFARMFSSAGTPLGSDIPVSAYTTSIQRSPSVASDSAGNFVVAWASYGQDGSDFGVF